MATVRVTVASLTGLHARPAAVFVQAVVACGLPVFISKPDDAGSPRVDARSILGVLALDLGCGDEVELSGDGEGAPDVLEGLALLLATGQPSA